MLSLQGSPSRLRSRERLSPTHVNRGAGWRRRRRRLREAVVHLGVILARELVQARWRSLGCQGTDRRGLLWGSGFGGCRRVGAEQVGVFMSIM